MMNVSSAAPARSSGRLWALDMLRILATLGIVILHTSPLAPEHGVVTGLPWQISITISNLCRWCVPVFVMISGALFLPSERNVPLGRLYGKTILRVGTCFVFWSAFYAVVHCVIMGKGKWTFINQLLRGHYHMWYIFAIIALYMLTPLVRKMTENRKATEYFLVLGLIFGFLIPRSIAFLQLLELPHADVIDSLRSAAAQVNPLPNASMLFYFVLGHYLFAYPVGKRMRALLYGLGAAGFVMTDALTIWHSIRLGSVSGHFYDLSSTTVLMMAAGIFVLFKQAFAQFAPGKRLTKCLVTLSACSFGVYLVHPFLVERLPFTLAPGAAALILGRLALGFAVYLLALCISYALHRIPVLGKYIV